MHGEDVAKWHGSMPDQYERYLVPAVFRPFAEDLARRARLHKPLRVLELAAGTGVLTRELVEALPDAEVVATDLNPSMVELGARQVPAASWRQADALDLPFDPAAFDLVVCQFGVMFFPDKAAGFAAAKRVLTDNGALLFNTWGTIAEHGFAAALMVALNSVLPEDPPTFVAAVPHGYPDSDVIAADLDAAGLTCGSVQRVVLTGEADSAADIAVGFCTGTPLRSELEARGDLDALTNRIAQQMEHRLGTGPVQARMTAYTVTAAPKG